MNDIIPTSYEGIAIEYHELDNLWHFELRGRERTAPSLATAKEAIDKPEPREKKPFTRTNAYLLRTSFLRGGEQQYPIVEVTSVAAATAYERSPHFWVVSPDGHRQKESQDVLAPVTEATTLKIAELKEAIAAKDKLQKQIEDGEKKLPKVQP